MPYQCPHDTLFSSFVVPIWAWGFVPEYAHIIGVPFKMFKGGKTDPPPLPDYTRIYALPERQEKYEIAFPNLAGYRVEPVEGDIRADFSEVDNYEFDGTKFPTRTILASSFSSEERELTVEAVKEKRDQELIYIFTRELIRRHYADEDGSPEFQKFNRLKAIVAYWYFNAVNEAVKECRTRGDADWLIILGFSFESNIANKSVTTSLGNFEVTKVRMHDDLMQEGLLKKDKKAASFVTIGEPDIKVHKNGKEIKLEIQGLDIYDPIKDVVSPRNIHDIAYWMVDDDYDGSNFVVRQVFFCGGDKDEFRKWQKGLSDLARQTTRSKAEKTLKIEIDDEAFDRLYGHISHPIEVMKKGQKVAVRVISQFGEESTKVIEI